MVLTGLYRVTFGTARGGGHGIAYLRDGHLHGGDSMMAYVGTYDISAGDFTAEVHAFQHSDVPGVTSMLGTSDAHLNIRGTVSGTTMTGQGTSPQASGVSLEVKLERLAD